MTRYLLLLLLVTVLLLSVVQTANGKKKKAKAKAKSADHADVTTTTTTTPTTGGSSSSSSSSDSDTISSDDGSNDASAAASKALYEASQVKETVYDSRTSAKSSSSGTNKASTPKASVNITKWDFCEGCKITVDAYALRAYERLRDMQTKKMPEQEVISRLFY